MVSPPPDAERRAHPAYALERVRELARGGRVRYATSSVQRDSENLGYAPEDVHECLASLDRRDFSHAERYPAIKFWYDVYLCRYRGPTGAVDPLYIKLKLDSGCLVVELFSFHRER